MRMSAAVAALACVSLLATACAGGAGSSAPAGEESPSAATETGRVAISYPGGIVMLDPETLEVVDELEAEEFTRLNAFGDGRTIAVTTSQVFQMLDTAEPALTNALFEGTTPGHVLIHGENTVQFDDGTGTTTIVPTDGYDPLPETTTYTADSPHHGVSIVLEDATLRRRRDLSHRRQGAARAR